MLRRRWVTEATRTRTARVHANYPQRWYTVRTCLSGSSGMRKAPIATASLPVQCHVSSDVSTQRGSRVVSSEGGHLTCRRGRCRSAYVPFAEPLLANPSALILCARIHQVLSFVVYVLALRPRWVDSGWSCAQHVTVSFVAVPLNRGPEWSLLFWLSQIVSYYFGVCGDIFWCAVCLCVCCVCLLRIYLF